MPVRTLPVFLSVEGPSCATAYPSHPEICKLATLAKLGDRSNFADHICSIILDAHFHHRSLRELSTPEVRSSLTAIARHARELRKLLEAIDVDSSGSKEHAGAILEQELGKFQDGAFLLPECVVCLNELDKAAERASDSLIPRRGPKGAGGNFAFDLVVQDLLIVALVRKGNWTNSRAKDGEWVGTFLDALTILKPYLPPGLFPHGELGRAVEHVRTKFNKHIAKNRRPEN